MATPEEVFTRICAGVKKASHVEGDEDGAFALELPLSYPDGSPLTLHVDPAGTIDDDGRTLMRLQAAGRLVGFEKWDDFEGFLRVHSMRRDGSRLLFSGGDPATFIRYLEALRQVELVAPKTREGSKAFDDLVRTSVKDKLRRMRENNSLSEEAYDRILHPNLIAHVPRPGAGAPTDIAVPVLVDFGNADGSAFVVVLSHGLQNPGDRLGHIKRKVAEVALIKNRPERVFAVAPTTGYSAQDLDVIEAFTGNPAIQVEPDRISEVMRVLLSAPDAVSQRRL